jgi:hypothetical protein
LLALCSKESTPVVGVSERPGFGLVASISTLKPFQLFVLDLLFKKHDKYQKKGKTTLISLSRDISPSMLCHITSWGSLARNHQQFCTIFSNMPYEFVVFRFSV